MSTTLYATNSGLKVEASIKPEYVSGQGAGVLPRLNFQVRLVITEEQGMGQQKPVQAWSFGMLSGELLVGTEKVADIRPYSINNRMLGGQNYPYDTHLNIEVQLDPRRIEWLEQKRAGKSFEATLKIQLQVQSFGFNQHTKDFSSGLLEASTIQGDIRFSVADTHWREQVLPGLGYGKVMMVELPAVSLEACKALDHSYKALEKAQKQLALGLYDDAVGSCRVALDQFFEQVDKPDDPGKKIPKLKKSWELRLGEATYQWLNSSLGAIKAEANTPHHSPNNHFDRLEAQMLMMVTTALISFAAAQIEESI
ncbi:MAG: hypothetical protein PHH36_07955 [Sideroxydans sp.]|nr:hypothetical protein [Sideroxydans sp.]